MTKAELRKAYTERRRSLTVQSRGEHGREILSRLFKTVDFGAARAVNSYIAIERSGEVETMPVFRSLWERWPHIATSAPKIDIAKGELEAISFERDTSLKEGPWRIPEPDGPVFDPLEIDIIIVPLLAVDVRGHRVGYGKGFYDRFLARCRPDCLKAGLSYFPPVDSIEDVHPGDVSLDLCITPTEAYRF